MLTVEGIKAATGCQGRHLWGTVHLLVVKEWQSFIRSHERHHISIDTLCDRGVSVQSLSWSPEDNVDFDNRFSQPRSMDEIERLYRRTRATNYHKPPNNLGYGIWKTSGAYTPSEGYEDDSTPPRRYRDRLDEAYAAAAYATDLIGFVQNPFHIASQGNWMKCCGGYRYRPLKSADFAPGPQWAVYCYFRSIPWPQKEFPVDAEKIARLQRRQESLLPGDWNRPTDDAIRRPGEKPTVHLGVVLVDEALPQEECLTTGEMQAALDAMTIQISQKYNWQNHAIFPVFIYSFAGRHVRVLQVHVDPLDCKLIVRKTSYIKISGPESTTEIKLLLQWMTAKPTGKTTFEELNIIMDEGEQSDMQDEPRSPGKQTLGTVQG